MKEYKNKKTGYSRYITKTNWRKIGLKIQHDMTNRDIKDLPRRTTSDKVFRDKACKILKMVPLLKVKLS